MIIRSGVLKFGRGKKGAAKQPIENTEEKAIDDFTNEIEAVFSNTNITWWFEQDIELQIQENDNEGLHKFWFEKEIISLGHLKQQFDLQKTSWLSKRYIPELHGMGVIQLDIQQLLYSATYRKQVCKELNVVVSSFQNAAVLIERLGKTLNHGELLCGNLEELLKDIQVNIGRVNEIEISLAEGTMALPKEVLPDLKITEDLLDQIEAISPTNLQLGIPKRLKNMLLRIRDIDVNDIIKQTAENANQLSRLFLGNPGTGKTHALTHTVDIQLHSENSPAIIIRAKGTPCGDWSQIFRKVLELEGWDKNQVLSALETLAIRNDHREAKKLATGELKREPTKVVICIDGLEEDTAHWRDWYERMRESLELMRRYPRVRFVFTARTYFLNEHEIPSHSGFKVTRIPLEGDIPVSDMLDRYFSPEHFNIQVNPKSLVRGLDSLFALRLFCELYQGQVLTSETAIITAEQGLLNAKVDRMENDFRQTRDFGSTRKPIREALTVLSESFYDNAELDHDQLITELQSGVGTYLSGNDIDKLVDFLADHGLLVKSEIPVGSGVLNRIKTVYGLTYQSIIELIMSDKFVEGIRAGEMKALPKVLLASAGPSHLGSEENSQLVNRRVIQNIVNRLFHEHGLLLGEQDFRTEGLEDDLIDELRINALINAPAAVAAKYESKVNELYFRDHRTRRYIFESLIYPSSASATNYFGAEYLHGVLMAQSSAFAREKFWLGWDRFDIHELDKPDRDTFHLYDLKSVLDPNGTHALRLPEFALHNERPLIYGWALSTLDQSFREGLRVALTKWALHQPREFHLLLGKLFHCNDPQIQEDLASITLGLAAKLTDKDAVGLLATWALDHVFNELGRFRNVIVRQGFRAIVEKAQSMGSIEDTTAAKARPQRLTPLELLPLDLESYEKGGEEIYPIVHDLAWYVIDDVFSKFLELETIGLNEEKDDEENEDEGRDFLKSYLPAIGGNPVNTYSWAMSAAIAYMKSLGFSRTEGNGFTDATHGAKSKNFTLEEKYTWLAVHHIQGYLADYLPFKETGRDLKDFMSITDVPNPAEFIDTSDRMGLVILEDNWLLKESLAPEMPSGEAADDLIKAAVEREPEIDFENWIQFKELDFIENGVDKDWLALFNYTSVHDSLQYVGSHIDIRGLLIEKGQIPGLLDLLRNYPDRTRFLEHIDRMVGSPETDTYSNPSDITWMSWIEEAEFRERYYTTEGEEKFLKYTVTSVTKNSVKGEEEIYIPSKVIRSFLGIVELDGQFFLDSAGHVKSYVHILKRPKNDRQEMVLVDREDLIKKLDEQGLDIVWFADLFISKNPLNDVIKSEQHPMKTRKYFIYFENDKLISEKVWDARFSNQRGVPSEGPEGGDFFDAL